ncbi:MAG: hypothetical protein V1837_00480 [Candidatus Woesearchaeota archaeon]
MTLGKKGIELSINMIVILIMCISMFVGGLYFTNKFMRLASDTKADLDAETQEKLEELLADGSQVAISFDHQIVKRGHDTLFGLGIQNTDRIAKTFYVNVSFSEAFASDGSAIAAAADYMNSHWIFSSFPGRQIDPNAHLTFSIKVAVQGQVSGSLGTLAGTYIFDVCVCGVATGSFADNCALKCPPDPPSDRSKLYDGYVHKIYVEVP